MATGKKPTVALLIETSRAYGRDLCLGVAEYARSHGDWNFLIEERDVLGRVDEPDPRDDPDEEGRDQLLPRELF